ncbi:type 4a pilus biogenesis protein PilO [Dactylosporangium aurantiacum]|uniref:Type 4a pilus biogenesis protein PilO n=1 Tax=Dactylosporangium aurantiacum TaxID=35754 RepID=A0A9Q9MEM4_9ACTN|nr:type 4a pilus biogenesis protein PilO [Dactylosporangium aurantiacum]MDG6102232.1 type 4a pilus biogenesis protein PilO [Dactylosporangium aurantiacum]UWZ53454.1 type 4a pilus biogenesis protein PilO [Dactylosporangium aurantiacum]
MRPERLWMLGGVFTAAILLVVGYYFVIRPRYQEADDLRTQANDTTIEVAKLRARIADLDKDNQNLQQYTAQLDKDLDALPESDSVAALLREVQNAGDLTGVAVSGVSVGGATDVDVAGPLKVYALPISLTAAGPAAKIDPFLDQLQKVQPRALLIGAANLATTEGRTSLTLTIQAFYATGK